MRRRVFRQRKDHFEVPFELGLRLARRSTAGVFPSVRNHVWPLRVVPPIGDSGLSSRQT
jgi:hypothetical protein